MLVKYIALPSPSECFPYFNFIETYCWSHLLQSATKYCWDIKTTHAPPPPFYSKLGCLLFSTGSSNSSTAAWRGWGGKALFPPCESSKKSENPLSHPQRPLCASAGERNKGPVGQSISTNLVANCNFKSFTITNHSNIFKKTTTKNTQKYIQANISNMYYAINHFFFLIFTRNSLPSALASNKLVKQMVNC